MKNACTYGREKSYHYQGRTVSGGFKSDWSTKSISSLSLREVAREAGIAPNSFYRHFKDIDELAIALIERSGIVLRQILHRHVLRL